MSRNLANINNYWPRERVDTLINEYEKRPLLWDTKHPGYNKKRLRELAISEIGKIINISNEEITRKINNLRSQYVAEIRKIERSKTTEKETGLYVSRWWLFKRFSFLKDNPDHENIEQVELSTPTSTFIIRLNTNTSDQEGEEAVLQLEEICADQICSIPEQCSSPIPGQCPSLTAEQCPFPTPEQCNSPVPEQCPSPTPEVSKVPFAPRKRRKVMVDATIQTTETTNEKSVKELVPDLSLNKDVCDSYGKYIAGEIKSISDIEQQQLLKLKIQQLVYYAHKGMLQEFEV